MKEIEVAESRRGGAKDGGQAHGAPKSCVICSLIGPHMERYAGAVAQMHGKDGEFKSFGKERAFAWGTFACCSTPQGMPKAAKRNICEPCPRCRQNLERLHAELGHLPTCSITKATASPGGLSRRAGKVHKQDLRKDYRKALRATKAFILYVI